MLRGTQYCYGDDELLPIEDRAWHTVKAQIVSILYMPHCLSAFAFGNLPGEVGYSLDSKDEDIRKTTAFLR
jgi:hypothetical protein